MNSNGPPGPYDRVPEARVSKSSHTTATAPSTPRAWDRRAALRVGMTAAMAVGSVALVSDCASEADRRRPATCPPSRIIGRQTRRCHRHGHRARPDPAANVRRAVEALGGMGRFVRRGERVVIKPNIGWNRTPEQAANTNTRRGGRGRALVVAAGASKCG